MANQIEWNYLVYGEGRLVIAATEEGLCYVGAWNEAYDVFEAWVGKHFAGIPLVQDEEAMRPFAEQLTEYLSGERTSFSVSLDLRGTPFQRSVWEAMNRIPYGRTASYQDIASALDRPKAVRAVGTAIGRNPVLIVGPCHRIVGKNGGLTGYRGGLPMKEQLLRLEGSAARG
jgi:methylated-DNA-[protein]-cysteine S-methyltransferase